MDDTKVFHAGTRTRDLDTVNDGGRVLGVTALGSDIPAAKAAAYQAVDLISWEGGWNRTDISDKA